MKELETWFSGGGLADIGLSMAGLVPNRAVELEESIASIYNQNLGNHCVVADVREYGKGDRLRHLESSTPFWWHVSPPCTNASNAKTDAGETELDVELAQAIARGLERCPPWFSLENVWGYRDFDAFLLVILPALKKNGYNFEWWHMNSADFGVPQTRKRLILIASRKTRVIRPMPTHSKNPDLFTQQWVGWYEAIADLILGLPETQFAKWQIERLPEELKTQWHPEEPQSFLTESKYPNRNAEKSWRPLDAPVPTVTALDPNWKGFLVDGKNIHPGDRPNHLPKAFLVDGQNARTAEKGGLSVREKEQPCFSVSSSVSVRKAFLVGDQKSGKDSVLMRSQDQPSYTIESSKNGVGAGRAFLVNGTPDCDGTRVTVRQQEEPSYTVSATANRQPSRAWLSQGRIVAMTPRCLARFQTLPDSYQLTGRNVLDCKIIGNGVPCRLMEQVAISQRF